MKRHQMQVDVTSDLDNVLSFDHLLLGSSFPVQVLSICTVESNVHSVD